MVKCKECGGQVSTKAVACPHCGAKRKAQGGGCFVATGKLIGGLIGLTVALALIAPMLNSSNKSSADPRQELRDFCRNAMKSYPGSDAAQQYDQCVETGTARLKERGVIQ
jgi:hypothetical protein